MCGAQPGVCPRRLKARFLAGEGPDPLHSRRPNAYGEYRLTRYQVAGIVRQVRMKLHPSFKATSHSLRRTPANCLYEGSGGDLIP